MDAIMRRALGLAVGHRPHPNPMVGAIVLDPTGRVIGEGSHTGPGSPHAEALALEEAGGRAAGATLVVTLEPCVHHGLTAPCVDAIIAAGISRVVVGATDPDPRVAGRGMASLEAAGIAVTSGVIESEVMEADAAYFHHRRTGLPLMTLKAAMTLDGQVAASDGTSRWITGPAAREDAHRLRAASDAILVGAGTVLADDPRLTVRLDGFTGRQPVPIVVAGRRTLPDTAAIMSSSPIVYSPRPLDLPAEVVVVGGTDEAVDLGAVAKDMAERGLLNVLVEGGPTIAGSLVGHGLVSRFAFYVGSRLAGGSGLPPVGGRWGTIAAATDLSIDAVTQFGGDLRIDARKVE